MVIFHIQDVFFFFSILWTFILPRSIRRLLWDFVWNAWHCQNTETCFVRLFFKVTIVTMVFGFSNAYRILYEIVDSLWCMVVVYFRSLFSTVVAHCIRMPLLETTCHTLRALLQHSPHFVKLCNGWSCACRAASCLDNVISLWIILKRDYLFNSFKCLTVISVALVM